MGKTTNSDTTLCRNFCAYYKPGRNEDLACRGFVVVHGLIKRGKRISLDRPDRITKADNRTRDLLRTRVCCDCDFRADGCDFVLTNGKAAPCGGVSLLSHLLGSGELKEEDIEMQNAKSKV